MKVDEREGGRDGKWMRVRKKIEKGKRGTASRLNRSRSSCNTLSRLDDVIGMIFTVQNGIASSSSNIILPKYLHPPQLTTP